MADFETKSSTKSMSGMLNVRRTFSYALLVILTVLSVFPFLILIVNSSRTHAAIQTTFTLLPGTKFLSNFTKLVSNENLPILHSIFNSVYVSLLTAVFSTYFSTMTAYGIYMYKFKGRGFTFKFIMAVMMVPSQVSACGFLRLMMKMGMLDNLAALYIPAIASPVVFFYMYQALESTLPYSIVEAARVDGAGRWRMMWYITLPALKPTIIIMLILRVGGILSTGYEQIFLMRNALNVSVAEVFDTYVYTRGLQNQQYSYSTAAGLFKSLVSMILVLSANWTAKKAGETGIY